LDMSEYMEKHNVSRLVGAPPGYVGYEEGGPLTEKIRRRPYSVVLLDEVEKAHPDVFNMLLQIMEEGRLTDSFGRNVDFKNTVIIMTSNLGSDIIKGGAGFGFGKRTEATDYDNVKSVLLKEIERFFRPEFINRLDDVVVFRPLTKDNLNLIVEYEVAKVTERVRLQGISMELDQRAKDFLIEKGFNPDFGARPLRRSVGQYVEDPLSEMLLSGEMKSGSKVVITRRTDENGKDQEFLYFDVKEAPAPAAPAADAGATPGGESTATADSGARTT
ncbi:MAG: AAA family ATPase, partial [Planctomyces sp.]